MLPEIGELVFSFVVGYMGALEFLFVVRHLYHWGFRHNPEMRDYKTEAESLRKLQEQLKVAIAEAKEREATGLKAMKDGVMYKDGFRIDEDKKKIEELKERIRIQEQIAERQREIEEELERQRKIEEETREKLKKAEEELRRMEEEKKREKQRVEEEKRKAEELKRKAEEEAKRKAEEEAKRKAEEEKRKAQDEEIKRKQAEEEENMKKILQAEKQREEEQRRLEEEQENQRKLIEAEKEKEEKQRQLEIAAEEARKQEEENERKLLLAEKERQEKQRQLEIEAEKQRQEEEEAERLRLEKEENELKLLQAEKDREEQQRQQEIEDEKIVQKLLEAERQREELEREKQAAEERENSAKLIAAEQEAIRKQREEEENDENVQKLLKAERELELKQQEMEEEAANLQRLIEAEKQMEERQRQMDTEALQKLKSAQEEMELKASAVEEEAFVKKEITQADQSVPQTVKIQYGQNASESLKPKSLLFSSLSEDASTVEPVSSLQSSFSTQQSSEAGIPDLNFEEYERQAPDGGEDMPSLQYSDEYLRSLDGIKNKPLVREDGSGRRRAFKKRRSSGSSTSSRESRASREEELKMFTSLEEEELENIRKGESEYDAIKYASEPTLKVVKPRRHKRSPAKDAKRDPSEKGSLEMLNEEDTNPWGEVKPENYKNTEFWKREKNLSIDEEQEEFDAKPRIQSPSSAAVNMPKMSSFEEATKSQHEEAISALKRQRSKDPEPIQEPGEESSETKNSKREASLETEDNSARQASPSTGMRRSPRVDEMKEFEEKWKSEDQKARTEAGKTSDIEIEYANDEEPMSPEHLLEGISDFYDFNASINPRRSRSRSKTPALNRSVSLPERRAPSPLNCSHIPARSESRSPSPDPASYKFIVQRIIPSLGAEPPSKSEPQDHGLSDFYDFNTKLNKDALPGATSRRYSDVHRTSIDYVLEDLKNENQLDVSSGAIAKKLLQLKTSPTTPEYERSISAEMRDIQKLKEETLRGNFKRSTYAGESMDFSDEFENLREEAKNFRRSQSKSRSPEDILEMKARLLARQQLQDEILDDIIKSSQDSEDFSLEITKSIVDRNRRASDTALIQKPEILFQIQDLIEETDENFNIIDCDPEEYHHFRRFSLGQEIPVEQYPEDYSYVSEIEIRPYVDLKTLTRKLEEQQVLEAVEQERELIREEGIEEVYESGSDDERQTVVEVDDEIDEDIFEYNEKPAEESHNEQSECEEADRELDRYAGRNADDWRELEEGAVGGITDEDSFQIDKIYDEAIKNRKPSGILRDFDSILKEIQISDEDRLEEENLIQDISYPNGSSTQNLDPGVFSPRSRSSRGSSRDSSRSLIEYERRDTEMRYLADPVMSARSSTRLRSRYGIVPSTSLPTGFEDETADVDLNYKPKKEYNWRKNFKLDDDLEEKLNKIDGQDLDTRKLSLGGESVTLFSQSPEHKVEDKIDEVNEEEQIDEKMDDEPEEATKSTSKKKKNKRKSRKGSKGSIGGEEQENDLQVTSVKEEKDSSKRKHRRETKKAPVKPAETEPSSTGQEDKPSSKQDEETESSQSKKKLKKYRKPKEEQIVLPKLDIILPMPEKKAPPPSVAALRAALSAPPPSAPPPPLEKKSLIDPKPKKLWETTSAVSNNKSPTIIPSTKTESKMISGKSTETKLVSSSATETKTESKVVISETIESKVVSLVVTETNAKSKAVSSVAIEEKLVSSSNSDSKVVSQVATESKVVSSIADEAKLVSSLATETNLISSSKSKISSLENNSLTLNSEKKNSSSNQLVDSIKENGISSENESMHIDLKETDGISSQTVAFTLETKSLTLTKDENQKIESANSEINDKQVPESIKSGIPIPVSNINQNEVTTETKNNSNIAGENGSLETNKSQLPIPQYLSESQPNPSKNSKIDQNSNACDTVNELTNQNQSTKLNLEPDILKDGGLYPLF